jgi:hypothetical protein
VFDRLCRADGSTVRRAISEPVDHRAEHLPRRSGHQDDMDVLERCTHGQHARPELGLPTGFTPHPDHEDVVTLSHITGITAPPTSPARHLSVHQELTAARPLRTDDAAVTAT